MGGEYEHEQVMKMGNGWNCLRTVSNGGFGLSVDKPSGSTTRDLIS
jgi:hypothetical protein